MRSLPFQIPVIARAAGCAAVAAAIGTTALHVQHNGTRGSALVTAPSLLSDPLAAELARCQAIGVAAQDNPACDSTWAANRRRFIEHQPAAKPEVQ